MSKVRWRHPPASNTRSLSAYCTLRVQRAALARGTTETRRSARSPLRQRRDDRGVIGRVLTFARVAIDDARGAARSHGPSGEDVIDAQALVLEERHAAIVPPRVDAAVGVVLAEQIDEAPRDDVGERGALGGRAVD